MSASRRKLNLPAESYLERAALDPGERSASVRHALKQIAKVIPAAGTALIRPQMNGTSPWCLEYEGEQKIEMSRWLTARLDDSYEATVRILKERAPHMPEALPLVLSLSSNPLVKGIWILWLYTGTSEVSLDTDGLENFRMNLETLLEVEYKEQLYFHTPESPLKPQLRDAIVNGDTQGLTALLNFAGLLTNADFTYWGEVSNDLVEVTWHLGAQDTDFGFELPVGEGIGGRSFDRQEVFHIADYLNCPYRYPGVSDMADRQGIRTVLVAPVYGRNSDAGALLFNIRRSVSPFSVAQRLLLLRLARGVESATGERSISQFYFPSTGKYMAEKRSELREILLHSDQPHDIEAWLAKFIKGPAILTDVEGNPYIPGNKDKLECMRRSSTESEQPEKSVTLRTSRINELGHLRIQPSIPLPPPGWPDFLDDVMTTCIVVIDRIEQEVHRLDRKRSRWLGRIVDQTTSQLLREGYHLGLPVDKGEVWAIAWTRQTFEDPKHEHLKLLMQDVALDQLGVPFILTDNDVGVFLLGEPARNKPIMIRDASLRVLNPTHLWLVHGAYYDSFRGLRQSLLQTLSTINNIRHENSEQYISVVGQQGLESLLGNPELSDHLDSFANDLLEPLIAYDARTNSQLTETLVLALTVRPTIEVAKRLHVHPKTVRYRVSRAEQILGKDLDLPVDKTALEMAAFVWGRHNLDHYRMSM